MGNEYHRWTDMELWLAVREAGDRSAFAELHRRFARTLYRLAYRKTGDAAVSEDLVQDLFMTLWMRRGQINLQKQLHVYLFSALKNHVISYLRKTMPFPHDSLDVIPAESLEVLSGNSTEELLLFNDAQKRYEAVLGTLPEKSREVFELNRSGLTHKEIAGLLNIVEKTVEFHMAKCLKLLREKLVYVWWGWVLGLFS